MKHRILTGFVFGLLTLMILAACQSTEPPTMYVMEVTRLVTVVVAPDDITGTAVAQASAEETEAGQEDDNTSEPASTVVPTLDVSATPTLSPTPDIFPTPVVGEIYLAKQSFERGNMYWVQPVNQIWVTTTDADGMKVWRVYEDTFEEGMPEEDPELEAPDGLLQPIRGFGKLWRETADLRTELGWATEGEIGYNTRYEYRAGGTVTEDNEYEPAPGFHLIDTREGTLRFNEDDRTWGFE